MVLKLEPPKNSSSANVCTLSSLIPSILSLQKSTNLELGDASSLREGVPAKLFLAQSDFVIMFPELSGSFGEYTTRK